MAFKTFFCLLILILSGSPQISAQNTNTYLGPDHRIPGNPKLVRVQILVYNDPNPKGVQINKVTFDQAIVPLKPRDVYGYRGQSSFQKRPGKYKLTWKVKRDAQDWPRVVTHEEEVTLSPRDFWIQITIIGNEASIS